MEQKNHLVAITYDRNGECKQVLKVSNVSESEYKRLLNEQRKHEQDIEEKLSSLESKVEELEKEIKVLKGEDYEESI